MTAVVSESRILITCPNRIAPFLAEEVLALGMPVAAELPAGVLTDGTMHDAMRLNLHVRTGHRVLYLLDEFEAYDPDEMYSWVKQIEWERWLDVDGYVSVVSSIDTPSIDNTQFANVRCKDAIVDRMVEQLGNRPDSGSRTDRAVVFLYWHEEVCAVYLDTSGDSLSNRGYRRIPWKAPMRETLAAAVVLATGWKGDGNFVNPMCGSGTLAIEAAMIATSRAPAMLRENFGFMHLSDFDRSAWDAMRAEARRASRKRIDGRIIASDINPDAIVAARRNAATAGVDHLIEFHVGDFAESPIPDDGGVVVLNPEYGARLGDEAKLLGIYSAIGDFFKQSCSDYTGYIFTGNPQLAKRVGLRTKRRLPFFNSTIDCRLLEFELYSGSRKHLPTTASE
ncbi:MAG: class I SAM-dependent RNA methyltransferase [bacterium]|nr:class I SAM-dependent RNA methyltransferase [Candidatus Kapabacteria bacterium]